MRDPNVHSMVIACFCIATLPSAMVRLAIANGCASD